MQQCFAKNSMDLAFATAFTCPLSGFFSPRLACIPTSSQQPTPLLPLKCTLRSFPFEECIANNPGE